MAEAVEALREKVAKMLSWIKKKIFSEIKGEISIVSQQLDDVTQRINALDTSVEAQAAAVEKKIDAILTGFAIGSFEGGGQTDPSLEIRALPPGIQSRFELAGRALVKLRDIKHFKGKCWVAKLPFDRELGDSASHPSKSNLKILEDGRPLGPGHAAHQFIIENGGGLYSHWMDTLYFSTSDGEEPGPQREYHVVLQDRLGIGAWNAVAAKLEHLPPAPTRDAIYAAVESILQHYYPEAVLGDLHKSFWRETALKEEYARLVGSNWRSFERKFGVINLLKLTHRIPGEYAECGVFEGATSYFVCRELQAAGVTRRVMLFDSFEGLSTPETVDGDYWGVGYLSVPETRARENLAEFGGVEFYRGWIPERFAEVATSRFAFVHIDVDLHRPTLDSLEFFYPRMNLGGVIVCDDYGYDTCPGARRAVDDFFADKPEPVVHLPSGQALVIKS